MTLRRLPPGLSPMGCSPVFSEETVPAVLQEEHALSESHWGVLQVLEGSVVFVDLEAGAELKLNAPDLMVVAPQSPHRLRLHGPLKCRVDFFREDDRVGHRTVFVAADDDVKLSFERCEASGDFGKRFYEIFLDSSDEIAPQFAETDFGKQRKLLRDSVRIMVSRDPRDPTMRETLRRIGDSHGRRGRAIPPLLYEYWLASLCNTVRELDPEWDDELEKKWRVRMRAGMQVITANY